jgi:tetratricopeptide (TPR) repeat protein
VRAFVVVLALGLALAACSAPATRPELAQAERRADRGDVEGALIDYRAAQVTCKRLRPERRATQACSEALLGEAQTLERAGRADEAINAYIAIPPKAPGDAMTGATATYRAGELLLERSKPVDAWTLLWRVVTDYPDEPLAADALELLLDDGRARDPQRLADEIGKLLAPLAETEVADNLMWSLADLNDHEIGNAAAARALYDRIPVDYPSSGLRDDARWHAARLSKQLGDYPGAVARLRALLATREVAFGAGSYFSIWLDDAQLELGKLLRDKLGDLPGAAAAFRKLPTDYPASILKDDALYELAVTLGKQGDTAGACRTIAQLHEDAPDSKYLDDAGNLDAELQCPSSR